MMDCLSTVHWMMDCLSTVHWMMNCLSTVHWMMDCLSTVHWMMDCLSTVYWIMDCLSTVYWMMEQKTKHNSKIKNCEKKRMFYQRCKRSISSQEWLQWDQTEAERSWFQRRSLLKHTQINETRQRQGDHGSSVGACSHAQIFQGTSW